MSSARFPGKVLAPLAGQPVIMRVISQVAKVIPTERITLATSSEPSDDPLASYVKEMGFTVFRGPLDNVFERFHACAREFPCDWFFRICGDSPLLDPTILTSMLKYADRPDADLVTNIQVRSFPKGHSLEMLRTESFMKIDPARLSVEEAEHLTKVYYNHPDEFNIINIESGDPSLARVNYTVDTTDDLLRLERSLQAGTKIWGR
jgi:spore coat polysaccharide biosynthesis protein SpsF